MNTRSKLTVPTHHPPTTTPICNQNLKSGNRTSQHGKDHDNEKSTSQNNPNPSTRNIKASQSTISVSLVPTCDNSQHHPSKISSLANASTRNQKCMKAIGSEKELKYLNEVQTEGSHADLYINMEKGISKRFIRKNNINFISSIEKQRIPRLNTTLEEAHTGPSCSPSTAGLSIPNMNINLGTPPTTIKYCNLKSSRVSQKSNTLQVSDSRIKISLNSVFNIDDATCPDNYRSARGGSFRNDRRDNSRRLNAFVEELRNPQQSSIKYSKSRLIEEKPPQTKITQSKHANNINVLKTELELKEKQIEILEDDKSRHCSIIEVLKKKEKNLQSRIQGFEEETRILKLENKNYLAKLEKLNISIKESQEEKKVLSCKLEDLERNFKIQEKQYKLLQKKILPKNINEFQSCREVWLEQTINELKLQLEKEKTQVQLELQSLVKNKQLQIISLTAEIKSMEIRNRMLSKKGEDSQRYLSAYKTTKQQLRDTKAQLKEKKTHHDALQKENLRLRRELRDYANGKGKREKQRILQQGSLDLSFSGSELQDSEHNPKFIGNNKYLSGI